MLETDHIEDDQQRQQDEHEEDGHAAAGAARLPLALPKRARLRLQQLVLAVGDGEIAFDQQRTRRERLLHHGNGFPHKFASLVIALLVDGQRLHDFVALAGGLFLVRHLEVDAGAQVVWPDLADAERHESAPVVRQVGRAKDGRQHGPQAEQHGALQQVRQDRIVAARGAAPAIPLAEPRRLLEGTKHK